GGANNVNYIQQGSDAALRLIVLNADLKPQKLANVQLEFSARRFVTSLVSDTQGLFRYDATPVETKIQTETVELSAEGSVWHIPTKEAGDFLLSVKMADGTTLAQIPFSVAGMRLAKMGEEPVLANSSLRMSLDRNEYNSGDTIHFRIQAPFDGTGLVTIERESVVEHAWFTAKCGESVHKIDIPKDFVGRGYVNVSFVRNADSNAIYMAPHVYAVVPFDCGLSQHELGLQMQVSDVVKPGTTLPVHVSTKKAGYLQIFAVDEGVLQLTGYQLPKPLQELLFNRALDVETREAVSLLMPDYERFRGRIPGFGGDKANGGGRFLNPFRRKNEPPVAFWSKLLAVDQKGIDVEIPIPDYFNGSVRVMAIASGVDDNQILVSQQEKTAFVRGGLILKPQLPLAVAPNDQFEGALVVANTIPDSKQAKVKLTLHMPDGLELVGKTDFELTVPEKEERIINFLIRAKDTAGEQNVRFEGIVDQKHFWRQQSLSVRPASFIQRTELVQNANNETTIESKRELYPFMATTKLTLAQKGLLTLRSILDRLDTYPYGCTEQKVSMAMPYVVLWDKP
ncbi:MAG: alpha-2-macroglobulin family protein, partial [Desulfovibrio sp.]|nr:alpha-2-macroglobulin family protein [Desulfovibrio sp.]